MNKISFLDKKLPIKERKAAGKALREKISFDEHAVFRVPSNRIDPVQIILEQNTKRDQALVPIRHSRMLVSPFAFLRGSAAVMAQDFSAGEVTSLQVQACGDVHVSNFGVFASAERNLIFGINDFDETHPGPWEWDLKRLTVSAIVAVNFLGGTNLQGEEAARTAAKSYRKWMRRYAEMGHLEIWYSTIREKDILNRTTKRTVKKAKAIDAVKLAKPASDTKILMV